MKYGRWIIWYFSDNIEPMRALEIGGYLIGVDYLKNTFDPNRDLLKRVKTGEILKLPTEGSIGDAAVAYFSRVIVMGRVLFYPVVLGMRISGLDLAGRFIAKLRKRN